MSKGACGVLEDPQAGFVAEIAKASERKLVLLSHHQLMSVYDQADLGPVLPAKLGPVLDSGRVTAWWWGHEHRCMGFEASHGVRFPRCVGHGGVPVLQTYTAGDPVKAPGAWEAPGFMADADGNHWARFGFAVLDLDGGQMHGPLPGRPGDPDQVRSHHVTRASMSSSPICASIGTCRLSERTSMPRRRISP